MGTLLLAGVLLGNGALSYVRTAWTTATKAAAERVPVEFQLDRARGMIKDLTPEVRKNLLVIATEEVEIKRLEEQIGGAETRLAKEKENILRLKVDLASGKKAVAYGTRTYTAEEVKNDLANRFERYKTSEATLASLKGIHQAREKGLVAARQRLDGMLASRRQLQVEVENLDARNQMVAAAQATSTYQFDDTELGRVKEVVSNLRTRIDVAERLVNAETDFQGEIPVDKATPQNIVEQVGGYFRETEEATAPENGSTKPAVSTPVTPPPATAPTASTPVTASPSAASTVSMAVDAPPPAVSTTSKPATVSPGAVPTVSTPAIVSPPAPTVSTASPAPPALTPVVFSPPAPPVPCEPPTVCGPARPVVVR
jgi:hypothetical protein